MPINHAQLRAFHAVAAEGGFTRAAAALHVTQPTLSAQVKELEATYGIRLFERVGRGVEVSELGRALFAITSRLASLESEAEQLLASARGLLRGNLRVMADAPHHIIPLLKPFAARYPAIRFSLTFGNTSEAIAAIHNRSCDVAVLPDLAPDPRIHQVPLRRDRLVLSVARAHPWARRKSVGLAELAGERMVLREPGSTTRALLEAALSAAGISLGETLDIGSREAVREAVAAELGAGVVLASEFGHDTRLVRIALGGPPIESTEFAACLRDRLSVRAVAAFFDLLPPA
ncbi:MAG: LysR substrate-binding domain-containing protein [Alphaproteobacteria bacterium]|nr:LysR substrate-binding domain-containing protein [Alphaproteobacteria bacterium]